MKTHLDIAHSGSLGDSDRTRMSFDENSLAHLMSVLTDLYSDQEMAVIREYTTNAIDSHIAAGNPDPVELTGPGSMNPVFTVRDYGVGMTADELRNHYSKYGFSSKRGTDEQTGMLGIGCKSALAYTSQFTVVASKDGNVVTALITREADGAGTIQIVEEFFDADARNGVEIRVPVKWYASFNEKINRFVQFTDPGAIILNGEKVVTIWEEHHPARPKIIDPDVILLDDDFQYHSVIVMGNVAYPIDRKYRVAPPELSAVARVPIGTINFTPSREELTYTRRTIDTINEIQQFVKNASFQAAQTAVDAATSPAEAVRIASSWRGAVPTWRLLYKSAPVPTDFMIRRARMLRRNWAQLSSSMLRSSRISGASFGSVEWIDNTDDAVISSTLPGSSLVVGVVTGFPNFPSNEWQADQIVRAFRLGDPKGWSQRMTKYGAILLVESISDTSWLPCEVMKWSYIKENFPSAKPVIKAKARPKMAPQVVVESLSGVVTEMKIDQLRKRDNSRVIGYSPNTVTARDSLNYIRAACLEHDRLKGTFSDDDEVVWIRNDSRVVARFAEVMEDSIPPLRKMYTPLLVKMYARLRFSMGHSAGTTRRPASVTMEALHVFNVDPGSDYFFQEARRYSNRIVQDLDGRFEASINLLGGAVNYSPEFDEFRLRATRIDGGSAIYFTIKRGPNNRKCLKLSAELAAAYPLLASYLEVATRDWEIRDELDIFDFEKSARHYRRRPLRSPETVAMLAKHHAIVNEYVAMVQQYRAR